MKIETAFFRYADYMAKKWSSQITINKYRNQIMKLFIFVRKNNSARTEITIRDIDMYIKAQKRSHNTMCTEIAQIKSFIKFCNAYNYVQLNHAQIFCPRKEVIEKKALSSTQIQKVLNKLENYDMKFRTGILLLLSTWTRISECCNITKKDIAEAILIGQNYKIKIFWKGRKWRNAFIPAPIYKIVQQTLKIHTESNAIGLNKDQMERKIRIFRKWLNFDLVAHTFRHTYCTNLAKLGTSIYKIQKLAWHSNINTTARYIHSDDLELSEAVNILGF